ncbi:MAG: amidohydrolase family protein [Bryobacteraceae bacterium]
MPPVCDGPDPSPRQPNFPIPESACDCHAHIFGPHARFPLSGQRTYTPPEATVELYRQLLSTLGLSRAVIVQPSVYGSDNRCTAEAVRRSDGRWRGVACIDLTSSDEDLAALHHAGLRAARVNGAAFDHLDALAERIGPLGWHVELASAARSLAPMAKRLAAIGIPLAIDHMGQIPVQAGVGDPDFQLLISLLREGSCWIKLSGGYRLSSDAEHVRPFFDALVQAGPDHLVWGTNWPHPWQYRERPWPMPNDGALLDLLGAWAPDPELRRRILVDNPARLYGF